MIIYTQDIFGFSSVRIIYPTVTWIDLTDGWV